MEQFDILMWFRLYERMAVLLAFALFVLALLVRYWNDGDRQINADVGRIAKISMAVTMPIVLGVMLLGFVYVALAFPLKAEIKQNILAGNPIETGTRGVIQLRLEHEDDNEVNEIIADLISREFTNENIALIPKIQSVMNAAVRLESLRQKDEAKFSEIISNESLSVKDITDQLDEMERE